jgi:hypothetical protein
MRPPPVAEKGSVRSEQTRSIESAEGASRATIFARCDAAKRLEDLSFSAK